MIDRNIRQFIRERAKYLCEYCHSPEEASAALFEIDQIFQLAEDKKITIFASKPLLVELEATLSRSPLTNFP